MADYLKLYGPAVANFMVTMGCYFHLKSKINDIRPDVKLDDVHARLDAIEKNLNQIIPILQRHDQFFKQIASERAPSTTQETEVSVTKPPTSEKKDQKAKSKMAKSKSKAAPKSVPKVEKASEGKEEVEEEDQNLEEELNAILGEDTDPQEIELEATEATVAEPPPKAKKSAAKKSFKKT